MRIGLNLLPWLPGLRGGVEVYDRNLVRALAALDSDDTFVLFLSREAVGALGVDSPRLEEWPCPVYSRFRSLRALWEQTRFGAWVGRARLDALLCPHILVPGRCPVPVVPVVHDIQVYDLPENFPPAKRAYLYRRLPAVARQAAHLIASSEFTKQRLIHHLQQPAERITVVPLAASEDFYPRSAEEVAAMRRRYRLERPYLFCPSASHKHKQLDRLVRAFGLLQEERGGGEAELVITGLPRGGQADLDRARRDLRRPEAVRHLGRVPFEDLPALYTGALGLAFPSRYEGFGLPVVEAMACGCPVACSNAASLPEAAGGAALLFDCESDAAVTAALRRLWEEPALREELRARGLERVRTATWPETARRTLAIVHGVARKPPAA